MIGATSTCSARIPHPPSPAATGTAMASSAEQRRSRVVRFLWLSRRREIRRENKNHQIFEIFSTHFWWIHFMYVHAIHTSIDGLEFLEFMSINAHECPSSLVSPSQPKNIFFTILAADRIFKVVMNMVVKSSPHQKSPEALFVCLFLCLSWNMMTYVNEHVGSREVELFGKEEFDIHLCGTKDL